MSMKLEEMLEEGAIQKIRPSENPFLSNLFLVKNRGMGNGPVINLKELNKFTLPNGRFTYSKVMFAKRAFDGQDRLKRCLFRGYLSGSKGKEACISSFVCVLRQLQSQEF